MASGICRQLTGALEAGEIDDCISLERVWMEGSHLAPGGGHLAPKSSSTYSSLIHFNHDNTPRGKHHSRFPDEARRSGVYTDL